MARIRIYFTELRLLIKKNWTKNIKYEAKNKIKK